MPQKLKAETAYYILTGASALFDAVMFVVLTVFYYREVGLDPLQLVLVGTVLEGACLALELPTGVVADLYSRRLSVVLGLLVLGVGFIVTGLARSFGLVLLAQVICALGYTFLSGATDAWLADEVGEEALAGIYLRAGQIGRITRMLGIGLNALLASLALALSIVVGGGLYLLLGLFLAAGMPETNFRPAAEKKAGPAALWATLREGLAVLRGRPLLRLLLVVNFFGGAASEGLDRLGDAHLAADFSFPALGALPPVVWFSLLALAGSLFSLATTALLGGRMQAVSRSPAATARTLLALNLVLAAAVAGFALAGSFWAAAACLLLRGAAYALILPLFNAWLVQNTASRARATVLSLASQSNALGQIAGGPAVGWVGSAFSLRAALLAAAALLAPVTALYARAGDH